MKRNWSRSLERPERWHDRRRSRSRRDWHGQGNAGGGVGRGASPSPVQHGGWPSGSNIPAALGRHGLDRAIIKRLKQFDSRGMLPWESLDESALSLLGRVDPDLVMDVLDEWEVRSGSTTPPRNHSAALVALVQRMRDERERRCGSYRSSSPPKQLPALLRRVEKQLFEGAIDEQAKQILEDVPTETALAILCDVQRKGQDMKNPSAFIVSRARSAIEKESDRGNLHDDRGGGKDKGKGKKGGVPHLDSTGETYIGIIKSFNEKTNYGFIACDEIQTEYGSDCFCAGRYMNGHSVGDTVEFDVAVTPQGKPQAVAVRSVSRRISQSRSRGGAVRRRPSPALRRRRAAMDPERRLQEIVNDLGLDDRARGMLREVPLEEAMSMLEGLMQRRDGVRNTSAFVTGAVRKYLDDYGSSGASSSQRRAGPDDVLGAGRGLGERGSACERRVDSERPRHRERYMRSLSRRRSRSRPRDWENAGDAGRGNADRMSGRVDSIDDQSREPLSRRASAVFQTAPKHQLLPLTRKGSRAPATSERPAAGGLVSKGVQGQIVELCHLAGLNEEATNRIKSISPSNALDILQSLLDKQQTADIPDTSKWVIEAVEEYVMHVAPADSNESLAHAMAAEDARGKGAPLSGSRLSSRREASRSRSSEPLPRRVPHVAAAVKMSSEGTSRGAVGDAAASRVELSKLLDSCSSLMDDRARRALDELPLEDQVDLVEDVVAKRIEPSSLSAYTVHSVRRCRNGNRDGARDGLDEQGGEAEMATSSKLRRSRSRSLKRSSTKAVDPRLHEILLDLGLADRACEALGGLKVETAIDIVQDVIRQGDVVENRSAWVYRAAITITTNGSSVTDVCAQRQSLTDELEPIMRRLQMNSRARQALAGVHPAEALRAMRDVEKKKESLRNPSAWVCWRIMCILGELQDADVPRRRDDEPDNSRATLAIADEEKAAPVEDSAEERKEVAASMTIGSDDKADVGNADEQKEKRVSAGAPAEKKDSEQSRAFTKKIREEGWMSTLSIEDWLHEVDEGKGFLKPFVSVVLESYETVEQVVDLMIMRDDEGASQFDPVFYEEIGLEKAEHRECFDRWASSHI